MPRDIVTSSRLTAHCPKGRAQAVANQKIKIMLLLTKSEAARRLGERADDLRQHLPKRKIWPLAQVARMFGVSQTLLRRWIKSGVLRKFRSLPHHRKGLGEREIRRFLREVSEAAEVVGNPTWNERARPAEKRCRDLATSMSSGESLIPREFAARANVAVTTVRRLAGDRRLPSFRPTPYRIRIGDQSQKKRRKFRKPFDRLLS